MRNAAFWTCSGAVKAPMAVQDTVEGLVRARAQQHLQPRDDARTPGFCRFERNQALFEFFSLIIALYRNKTSNILGEVIQCFECRIST